MPIKVHVSTTQNYLMVYSHLHLVYASLPEKAVCGVPSFTSHTDDKRPQCWSLCWQHMQEMMDKIYEFSCRWRFLIHPDKTKILTFGEPKRVQQLKSKQRGWHVGNTCTSEIDSHTHCGILLSTSTSTV